MCRSSPSLYAAKSVVQAPMSSIATPTSFSSSAKTARDVANGSKTSSCTR